MRTLSHTLGSLLSFSCSLLAAGAFAGCAAPVADADEVESAEEAVTAGPDTVLANVTGSAAFRVRAGGITVWVDPVAVASRANGSLKATLRFRTSRSLESAMGWVPDDGFGDARLVSPRVVEVDLRNGHEINSILSGLPLFVHLRTTSGADRDYDVRLDLAPRFARFSGATSVVIDRDMAPVYYRDDISNLRYRYDIHAAGSTAMGAYIAAQPAPLLAPLGGGVYQASWTYDRLEGGFGLEGAAQHAGTFRGTKRTKTAEIDLAIPRVGLTKVGAERAWPTPVCSATVKACIAAKGPTEKDLGACGSYRDVHRCMFADDE